MTSGVLQKSPSNLYRTPARDGVAKSDEDSSSFSDTGSVIIDTDRYSSRTGRSRYHAHMISPRTVRLRSDFAADEENAWVGSPPDGSDTGRRRRRVTRKLEGSSRGSTMKAESWEGDDSVQQPSSANGDRKRLSDRLRARPRSIERRTEEHDTEVHERRRGRLGASSRSIPRRTANNDETSRGSLRRQNKRASVEAERRLARLEVELAGGSFGDALCRALEDDEERFNAHLRISKECMMLYRRKLGLPLLPPPPPPPPSSSIIMKNEHDALLL